jgi:ubiquinone/menaquinone biosynthesis C-methylase UbiE
MSSGEVEQALLDAAQLEPEQDILVLGGGSLALAAHEQIGDGWVYVVRSQVDELEELLGEAHAMGASGVAYLVGAAPVLPLPDASRSRSRTRRRGTSWQARSWRRGSRKSRSRWPAGRPW